jgi:uncharacterized protein YcbX
MHISALAIHPLKSAKALAVDELALDDFGPAWDRRWMLVDGAGQFVTQRTHPRLCLLAATVQAGVLTLSAPDRPALTATPDSVPASLPVTVWNDTVTATTVSAAADAWCSDFLGMPVRLVFMPEGLRRPVDERYAGPGHRTAFSDGFPLLLVTQSALDHLNALLREAGEPVVDWRRFRPNVVVAGALPAHAEDGWKRLRVGAVELAAVKPCSRCVVPSIDPDTARKDSRILDILRTYRACADGRVYVGQNVIVTQRPAGARLRVGDAVEILE